LEIYLFIYYSDN